jgi:hypothetical protein
MQEYRIHLQTTVPHSPWRNRAEACIHKLKKYVCKVLHQTGAPVQLWTYCATWCAAVLRFTASSMGRVPETHMNGSTPDISALVLFDWYHLVYYLTPNTSFLTDKKFVWRFLGIAETCVDEMAFYILTENGDVIIHKNIWAIPDDKLKQPGANAKVLNMERMLKERFGDTMSTFAASLSKKDIINCTDDVQDEEYDGSLKEPTPELHDVYVGAEVFLATDRVRARVLHRVCDGDNRPIGIRHHNPMLDSREYELEFADGSKARANANLTVKNL